MKVIKIVIRLLVLPLFASIFLISLLIAYFTLLYRFIVYGGEAVTFDSEVNKTSIKNTYKEFQTYLNNQNN
jgi:hypothetical protein